MTKRELKDDNPAQSERFRETVRELEAAGELNPIEADKILDGVVRRSPVKSPSESNLAHNVKPGKPGTNV